MIDITTIVSLRYTALRAIARAYGIASRTSGHVTARWNDGRADARPRTMYAVMARVIAPAGIVTARNGATPAPTTISTTISETEMNCRSSSSAETQPWRSSTWSGTVRSPWLRMMTMPRPPSAVPATRASLYPAAYAKITATTAPVPVKTMRAPSRFAMSCRRRSAAVVVYSLTAIAIRPASVRTPTIVMSDRTAA